MRFSFDHWLVREDAEFELRVTYEGSRHVPATRWQPAEGGEVELISITHCGKEFVCTSAEEAGLIEVCEERVASDFYEEACAAAEYRAEQRRDDQLMGLR